MTLCPENGSGQNSLTSIIDNTSKTMRDRYAYNLSMDRYWEFIGGLSHLFTAIIPG
jgi:hypothetical protein